MTSEKDHMHITARKIAKAYAKEFPNGGKGEKNLESAKYASDAKTIKRKGASHA